MASIQQIMGKVNPLLYAENGKELLKKYKSIDRIPADEVEPKSLGEHTLNYDSPSETLEPVYFYILDLMNSNNFKTEKIVDNFASSPGSAHFSELGTRATVMQQQGTQMMERINDIVKSVLNIIYDLRDFRTRLQAYDDLNSKDNKVSAYLVLKQIWIDKVDIQKGNSSIKGMALGGGGFQTLIDAFLVAKDEKDIEKMDLGDRVLRILKPRIHEFNIWVKESERELRKRYELEKTYLKSQVNSLKLYSRWAKPYLKAAQQLEMKESIGEPALVKVFNTLLLELTLFGKSKIDVKDAAIGGDVPEDFKKLKTKRDYYSCVLVEFKFRSIPQKANQQAYVFGGKAEMKFTSYALNSEEIDMINKELEKDDVNDALKLIEGATTESLGNMQDEIDLFLNEDKKDSKKEKSGSNPFLALIGSYNKTSEKKDSKKEDKEIKIKSDDWIEKTHLRSLAMKESKDQAFDLFDVYKKSNGMQSYT